MEDKVSSSENDFKAENAVKAELPQANDNLLSRVRENIVNTKEKVYDFFRYKYLKVKEYFGVINSDEFGEVLNYDFKDELKDIEPIDGVFSPMEELKKVRQLPIQSDERKGALEKFRSDYVKQTQAWASCRVFIEREIEFNNDVDKGRLSVWVDKFGEKYGFDEKQKKIAGELIDGYYTKRARVKQFREENSDDTTLIKKLTGVEVKKREVGVSVGPMSIEIVTNTDTFKRLYKNRDLVAKVPYVGFASWKGEGDDEIYFTVVDKEAIGSQERKEVAEHEREHLKNRLFRSVLNSEDDDTNDFRLLKNSKEETNREKRVGLFETWALSRRFKALERAKDEILAMKRGGWWQLDRFFKQDGKAYDYLHKEREEGVKDKDFSKLTNSLLVDEYKKAIESGMEAFDSLRKVAKTSVDETIAVLANKSLGQWPRAVRRFSREMLQST